MRVGILGSGEVARSLGNGFATLGHEVKLGTRHPEDPKLAAWLRAHPGKRTVGSFAEAAEFGEILVVAVRGVAVADAVAAAGPARFDGKVVIDVTNPLVMRETGPPTLAVGPAGSAGEALQALLPHGRVVKAFNIVGNPSFFRPAFPGGPPDMFLCGNDPAAKRVVTGLLHDFGWSSVIDIGGIDGSRELEALCVLWVKAGLAIGNFQIAFKLLRK